jgi:WD40 repeat protein
MTGIHVLRGHGDWIYAVAFSHDGNRVVSGGNDNTLRLWHANQGVLIKEMKGHTDTVWSVTFSPEGRFIEDMQSD